MTRFIRLIILLLLVFVCVESQEKNTPPAPPAGPGDAFIAECQKAMAAEKWEEAVTFAEKAVQTAPENSAYRLCLGDAYGLMAQHASIFRKFSFAKKCKGEYVKAVALDGKSLDARFKLLRYLVMAPGIAGGSYSDAHEQATKISALDPVMGCFARSMIYTHRKEYDKAEKELKAAILLDKTRIESYNALAQLYGLMKRRGDEQALLKQILEIDPAQYVIYYALGKSEMEPGGDPRRALEWFEKFLACPEGAFTEYRPYAWWRIGEIYKKMGRREKAAESYQKALELNPQNKNAREALAQIK